MAFSETLEVIVVGKDQASGVLNGIADAASGLGGIAAGVLKLGLGAATAGFGALTAEIGLAVKAASDSEEVISQTNAVLKSTHGVAGMTAQAVADLASHFQGLTRFSDEAIQSGENMLLTFTNIGKNIFPQATEMILNMSQALGQDMKSSAIQLGKALQDPIQGVTALRRVGVNFTDSQKDMIKGLVESGHLLDAQRMILKELQVEFGGSAVAAGQTFAGQLDILHNKFDDVQEKIGAAFIPVLQHLTSILIPLAEKYLPVIVDIFTNDIAPALDTVVDIFETFIKHVERGQGPIDALIDALNKAGFEDVANTLQDIKDALEPIVEAFSDFVDDLRSGKDPLDAVKGLLSDLLPDDLASKINDAIGKLQEFKDKVGELQDKLKDGFQLTDILPADKASGVQQAIDTIIGKFGDLKDWFAANWPTIQAVFLTVWTVILATFESVKKVFVEDTWPQLKSAFDELGKAFGALGITWEDVGHALVTGITVVATVIGGLILGLIGIFTGLVNGIASALNYIIPLVQSWVGHVTGAFTGWLQMMTGLVFAVIKLFQGDLPGALQSLKMAAQGFVDQWRNIFQAAWDGTRILLGGIITFIGGFVQGVLDFFKHLSNELVGHSIIPDMLNAIYDVFVRIFNQILDFIETVVTRIKNKAGEIKDGVINAVQGALDTIGDMANKFYQFGSNIVQAIINGINDGSAALVDAITTLVTDTVTAIINTLQIGSPSRVFMNIGANMMAGLVKGIKDNALPVFDVVAQVGNKASDLAGGGVTTLDQSMTMRNYGPQNFNFQNVADLPGFLRQLQQAQT